MILIAKTQLTGDYGTVTTGQEFEVSNDIGEQLLAIGIARKPDPPKVLYEYRRGGLVYAAPDVDAQRPQRQKGVR